MDRTSQRPLVTGMVSPRECLAFGITLAVVSTLLFGLTVNWLSAWLSLGALLFYVVVYTMILKRRTSQNIVWGGIAGCMPVLIGWSSVTDTVSWAPVILFLVMFFWTPPHYWPLSMKVKDDYARVGVPMLPVIASNKVVARQIVIYSWVMVAVSLLLTPLGYTGWFYTAVALVAGGWWLWEAHALQNRARPRRPAASSRRCACSTGPSPTSRCCSSPSRWTPSCASGHSYEADGWGAWSRPRTPPVAV